MTPQEKVEELIMNLGVYNGLYLAEEVLIVLEDYNELGDINEWTEVRDLLKEKEEQLN